MHRKRALTLLAWLVAAFAACTQVESAQPPPDVSVGANGFGGEADGGSGSLAGEAGHDQGGSGVSQAGAPAAIEIGIWPTFAQGAQDADAAAVLASISALSAGSAVLPVYERWDALSGATGSPRAVTWDRLEAMFAPYRERGRTLALCIGIVDRTSPAWPFAGTLDTDEARAAIRSTIDEVFKRYASHLGHLCFGYEVDRYLAQASSADQASLIAFLEHAVGYAEGRGPTTGVAVTLSGASDASLLADLTVRGDAVVAVYDPLDAEAALEPPEAVADELASAFETVQALDGKAKRLALFEAGYPSSAAAGSSAEQQQAYYESLFEALEPSSERLAFVGLFGLGDRSAAACELEALSFGAAQEERALVRCSMGLRAESDAPKPAWATVLQAISLYR